MNIMRSVVLGCGSYLPSRVVTNAELSGMVDTSDEWIIQRTGIRERRIAAEGETTSEMGIKAARAALAAAGVDAQSIDLVVLATSTPDNTFPASAVVIQAGLGITQGAAFDLQACSHAGPVYLGVEPLQPGGTTAKSPAWVPVVRQPGEANTSVHMSSIGSR